MSRYAIARRRCIVIKYSRDTRYVNTEKPSPSAASSPSQSLSSEEGEETSPLGVSRVVTHDRISHSGDSLSVLITFNSLPNLVFCSFFLFFTKRLQVAHQKERF